MVRLLKGYGVFLLATIIIALAISGTMITEGRSIDRVPGVRRLNWATYNVLINTGALEEVFNAKILVNVTYINGSKIAFTITP